jgi:hypothetical protein
VLGLFVTTEYLCNFRNRLSKLLTSAASPRICWPGEKVLSHFAVCCWIDWLLMIKNCLIESGPPCRIKVVKHNAQFHKGNCRENVSEKVNKGHVFVITDLHICTRENTYFQLRPLQNKFYRRIELARWKMWVIIGWRRSTGLPLMVVCWASRFKMVDASHYILIMGNLTSLLLGDTPIVVQLQDEPKRKSHH